MGEYVLKVLTDIFFYLTLFTPVILTVPSFAKIILILVPAVWAVWVGLNWKKRDFMEALPDHFFLQVKLLAVFGLLEIFFIGITRWTEICAPFGIFYAVVGITAMKTGRIAGGNQKKGLFWLTCAAEIGVAAAAGLFLSSDLFTGGLLALLGGAYKLLILPILLLLIQGISKILEVIWPYLMKIFSNEIKFQASEEGISINGDLGVELEQAELAAGAEYLKLIGIGIAVFAVGFFLWFLYRKFSKTYDSGRKMYGTVSHSAVSVSEPEEEKRPLFGGERNVRHYYRKFMKLCRKHGEFENKHVTSAQVHEIAKYHWDERPLEELRELYLKVRYGGMQDGTEERKRARELYKGLKEADVK